MSNSLANLAKVIVLTEVQQKRVYPRVQQELYNTSP